MLLLALIFLWASGHPGLALLVLVVCLIDED